MAPTQNIFDTLAQHETELQQHNAAAAPTTAQPNIFDTLAANEGNLQKHDTEEPEKLNSFEQHWRDIKQMVTEPTPGSLHHTFLAAPQDAGEHVAHSTGGQAALIKYRLAKQIMDAHNAVVNAKPGEVFHKAVETFKQALAGLGDPVNAAMLAAGGGIKAGEFAEVPAGGASSGEAPSLAKQVLKGEKVAQEPAKAAIRGAAGAEEEAALLEGNKTVLDEPLKGISTKEKAAYAKQDEAAGFDVKETRKKLSDAEYKVKQPEIDEAARTRLEKVIEESKQNLAEAEKRMKEAGVDVKAADRLHQQRMAGQDFKKALVQHVSPDGESVNVDGLLNASKKLRFSKYGDRLEQFMGKEGAEKYMAELQKAQEAGVHAMKTQAIAKWVGRIAGLGATGEIAKHLIPSN